MYTQILPILCGYTALLHLPNDGSLLRRQVDRYTAHKYAPIPSDKTSHAEEFYFLHSSKPRDICCKMLVSKWWLGLWAGAIPAAGAAPSTQPRVFEQLDRVPAGWSQGNSAPCPEQRIKLQIAIRQEGKHALLEQQLLSISTPGHALYGEHYGPQQLSALFRPDPAVSSSVISWLQEASIHDTDIEDNGDWVNINTTIGQAETLLHTKFDFFHHVDETVQPRIRTLQYSIPQHLHRHIQMIQPTTHFARAMPYQTGGDSGGPIPVYGSPTKLNATYCNTTTPPDCLRALYKMGDFKANASSGVKLGISGFNFQQAVHSDLNLFLGKWAPAEGGASFKVKTSNGGVNNETGALVWAHEANLDIQYAVSLANGIPATFYKTGGVGPLIPDLQQPNESESLDFQEPFLELQYLLNLPQKDLPTVLSVSYGEDEQSYPLSYMKSVCQLFAKLGTRGVSVLVSR